MYLVGLTGGIATGKSTVSEMFASLGVAVIDADIMARKVVQPGRRAWRQIREKFGEEVFHTDGTLNRAALGKIIFEDAAKRKQLNGITHPEIFREICWEIVSKFVRGYKFVILDLPLLFESGMWARYLECIIVVSCEDDLQIQRLMHRNELSEADAITRIRAQMPLAEKCLKAKYVIDNSGTLEDTKRQLLWIHDELNSNKAYLKYRVPAITILTVLTGGVSLLLTWLIGKVIQL